MGSRTDPGCRFVPGIFRFCFQLSLQNARISGGSVPTIDTGARSPGGGVRRQCTGRICDQGSGARVPVSKYPNR
jgi:hypothetical protein